MDAAKRKRLELAGYKIYDDAADWLGLTEEEKKQLDLRETMARAVKTLRESSGLTQAQLAVRIRSKQPKIANLEAGRGGFTLDYAAKVYRAMGGEVTIKAKPPKRRKAKPAAP